MTRTITVRLSRVNNHVVTYRTVPLPLKCLAMDIYATRKARIWRLVEREFDGKKRRFADAIRGSRTEESARAMVYRWFPATDTADTRAFNYETARQIEEAIGLIPLCLDSFDLDAPYRRDAEHDGNSKGSALSPSDDERRGHQHAASNTAHETSYAWPFKNVDRNRFDALNAEGKKAVEFALRGAIAAAEEDGLLDTLHSKRSA